MQIALLCTSPKKDIPPTPVGTKTSNVVMSYTNPVQYDESTNPKDVNWISQVIEEKIAPYKPNVMIFCNTDVDPATAEAAFTAILHQR